MRLRRRSTSNNYRRIWSVMSDGPKSTFKKKAKSGKTSYSAPIVLRENTKTKIEAIPHFFDRRGTEVLTISIKKYFFDDHSRRMEVDEKSSFSLNPEETELLTSGLAELRSLLGAAPDQNYINIPLDGDNFEIPSARKQEVVSSLIRAVTNPELSEALIAHSPSDDLVRIMKTGIRVAEMRSATWEFEEMLADTTLTEHDYQKWFDRHYWVFGNAYIAKDDIRRISRSDDVDMLLQQTASGLRDIIELKRPNFPVLKRDDDRKQYYFSPQASQAIGQCDRYLNIFAQEARQGLIDRQDIVAHHPRAIVVIGRSKDWDAEKRKALHSLNSRMHGISIMTFDHVLHQAHQMLKIAGDDARKRLDGQGLDDFDDEIPF